MNEESTGHRISGDVLPILLNSIKTISSSTEYQKIHALMLEELSRLTQARGGSIFQFVDGKLILKHSLDPEHVPDTISLPLHESSPLQKSVDTKQDMLVKDIEQKGKRDNWKGYNDGSFMVLPLMDHMDNILAIINLHNKVQPPFHEKDLECARLFVEFCANLLCLLQQTEPVEAGQSYLIDLVNHLPQGFLLFDYEGIIHDVSAPFAELIGKPPHECLGKSIWELTPDNWHDTEKRLFEEIINGKSPASLDKTFTRSDGSSVSVHMSYTLFRPPPRWRILANIETMPAGDA